MGNIQVQPDSLAAAGTQFMTASRGMQELQDRLFRTVATLDMELLAREAIDAQIAAVGRTLRTLSTDAGELGLALSRIARAFGDADRNGSDRLDKSVANLRANLQHELQTAKAAWWQASLRGDRIGMDLAHGQAEMVRALGASDTDAMNGEVAAQYQPQVQLAQSKLGWWKAWAVNDQAGMDKAHGQAEAVRAAGTPELGTAENLFVMSQALGAVLLLRQQAIMRGDPAAAAALGIKADSLRAQGATILAADQKRLGELAAAPDATPSGYKPQFDGKAPAPGTTDRDRVWQLGTPAITSDATNRDPARYADVLNQFGVEKNPRYEIRDTSGDGVKDTFCNIFVTDTTEAMGAPIPHWIDRATGEPCPPDVVRAASGYGALAGRAWEMDANSTARWLAGDGADHGWRAVSPEAAQAWANQGKPAVAAQDRGSEIGHVAMVRPGDFSAGEGPTIAQAGGENYNETHVETGFGTRTGVVYYVHD